MYVPWLFPDTRSSRVVQVSLFQTSCSQAFSTVPIQFNWATQGPCSWLFDFIVDDLLLGAQAGLARKLASSCYGATCSSLAKQAQVVRSKLILNDLNMV